MPRNPLPVSVIQKNIFAQLQASQAIFGQVRALASIADTYKENQTLANDIEAVMRSLLATGEHLSEEAKRTGDAVLTFVKAE